MAQQPQKACTACIRIALSLTRTAVSITLITHGIPINSPKPFIGCGYARESIWTKTVAKKPPEWVSANVVVPKWNDIANLLNQLCRGSSAGNNAQYAVDIKYVPRCLSLMIGLTFYRKAHACPALSEWTYNGWFS